MNRYDKFFLYNNKDVRMQTMDLPNNVYAVILAGGSGTRFWPKSRQKSPKQLCVLGEGAETMLETTLSRLDGFIPPERRLIVTHQDQLESTRSIVGRRCPVIIAEPDARNTANALALAAIEISKRYGNEDAIMISLHADHIIADVSKFKASLSTAVDIAKSGELCLVGIIPKYPETGYGYIEQGTKRAERGAYRVASFREKPPLDVAQEYVKSGKFYWNAGLFVFPVRVFMEELHAKLPGTVESLRAATRSEASLTNMDRQRLAAVYASLPKISVDHAVLEVSKRVSVVEADIGWQDVGSWDALSQCFKTDSQGNFKRGDVLVIDSQNCTIDSDGPLTAVLGMKDTVVVHAKNAILVCPKDRAQDVKVIVDRLKESGRLDFI
jgi:mannose-1-phosphate guanylyltransferase